MTEENLGKKKKFNKVVLSKIHRISAWMLSVFSIATIVTGYIQTAHLAKNKYLAADIHRVFEWCFLGSLVLHLIFSYIFGKIKWKRSFKAIRHGRNLDIHIPRVLQHISSWIILAFGLLVVMSGLVEYRVFNNLWGSAITFGFHRKFDLALTIFIILHITLGMRFFLMRQHLSTKKTFGIMFLVLIILTFPIIQFELIKKNRQISFFRYNEDPNSILITEELYPFKPDRVTQYRPDLFVPGYFSLWDIFVHTAELEDWDLSFHFNESLNTYVINSLEGHDSWWYFAYYDGGWEELNAYRMDHFLWKPQTTLVMYHRPASEISNIHQKFFEEYQRLAQNNGTIIIPDVIITGETEHYEFHNVSVKAFNTRNDTLQNGVITALDVLLSLEELGEIIVSLTYYSEIRTFFGEYITVGNYWVSRIGLDSAYQNCGWVYEEGSQDYPLFTGNHIHVPSDIRILNSPEYESWFWICV